MSINRQKFYSTGQAAKMCGVSNRTLLNWIAKDLLPSHKLPGSRGDHRICPEDLATFMSGADIPLPDELAAFVKSILIIDDDKNMCWAIARTLKPLDLRCHFAHTAFEAGIAYAEIRPRLITLDIQLPDINGLALLKQLKANASFDSKLVVISGSQALWLQQAEASGADAVFSKPFDNNLLVSTIERLLH